MSNTLAPEHTVAAPEVAALVITTEPRLTVSDRCDSCGAQAYIAAEVKGTELIYCAHHGRKYKDKLTLVASKWHDETHKLDGENRAKGEN